MEFLNIEEILNIMGFFMNKKTYIILSSLFASATLTFFIYFFMEKTNNIDKDEKYKRALIELFIEADKKIEFIPLVGDYIKDKATLKRVKELVDVDKILCEIGGVYQISINSDGQPKDIFCGEKDNLKNKIITPRFSSKGLQRYKK